MSSKIEIRNGALHTNNAAAFAREFDVPQTASPGGRMVRVGPSVRGIVEERWRPTAEGGA